MAHPTLLRLAVMLGIVNALGMMAVTILILVSQEHLGLSAVGHGALLTAGAAGGGLGDLVCPWVAARIGGQHSLRHAMDFHGVVRIGTNLPDKRVFQNLRREVAEIQARNGGRPITDADREAIARKLRVKVESVKRMEPRIFAADVAIAPTDACETEDDRGGHQTVARGNVISIEGGQKAVERDMDQREVMARIVSIVEANFQDRDLEIVRARLQGDMTREKYDALVDKHHISVERIRQIQRAALGVIRVQLMDDGIEGVSAVSC